MKLVLCIVAILVLVHSGQFKSLGQAEGDAAEIHLIEVQRGRRESVVYDPERSRTRRKIFTSRKQDVVGGGRDLEARERRGFSALGDFLTKRRFSSRPLGQYEQRVATPGRLPSGSARYLHGWDVIIRS